VGPAQRKQAIFDLFSQGPVWHVRGGNLMANGNTEEWLIKLQDSITQLMLSSSSVESKIDQVVDSVAKLEKSMEDLKNITSNQETRIQLLESHCARIPERLNEDFALMKSQLKSYRQFLWMTSSILIGLVLKTLYDSIGAL